jgi:tRNA nucleotidyltransferase (CCA-adding enzyme)
LERLAKCDRAAVALTQYRRELGEQLQQQIRPTIKTTWLAIAKLTGLLSSDSQKAEGELLHLKYSRAEIRAAIALLENLPKVSSAEAVNSLSVRDWFFLFQTLEQTFPALAVLAVAIGTPMEAIAPWIDRYLTPDDPVAHPRQLINGKELMAALHLRKGPQIGRLLREIQVAQAEGKVATKADAIQFAQALMAQQGARQPK